MVVPRLLGDVRFGKGLAFGVDNRRRIAISGNGCKMNNEREMMSKGRMLCDIY